MNEMQINAALEKFKTLLIEQDERNQKIKATKEFKDFKISIKLLSVFAVVTALVLSSQKNLQTFSNSF